MKKLVIVVVLAVFALFMVGSGYATTYYVDENASGDNDGSSKKHAWANLDSAALHATAGDEVLVWKGSYAGDGVTFTGCGSAVTLRAMSDSTILTNDVSGNIFTIAGSGDKLIIVGFRIKPLKWGDDDQFIIAGNATNREVLFVGCIIDLLMLGPRICSASNPPAVVFENCYITSKYYYGLWYIADLTFRSCTLKMTDVTTSLSRATTVSMENCYILGDGTTKFQDSSNPVTTGSYTNVQFSAMDTTDMGTGSADMDSIATGQYTESGSWPLWMYSVSSGSKLIGAGENGKLNGALFGAGFKVGE